MWALLMSVTNRGDGHGYQLTIHDVMVESSLYCMWIQIYDRKQANSSDDEPVFENYMDVLNL